MGSSEQTLHADDRTHPLENRIPPPLVTLSIGAGMWAVNGLTAAFRISQQVRVFGGGALALAGFSLLFMGVYVFGRAKTTIDPVQIGRASSLVRGGVYRFTRNPRYLGFALVLEGWAWFLATPLSMLGPVIFVFFTNRFQIVSEERMMLAKFGNDYETYRRSVRRWL